MALHEGILILLKKSQIEKKLFKPSEKWFVLNSGDLPGQYFLDYYTDSKCKKKKGRVDLDQCKRIQRKLDSTKPDECLFSIETTKRTYNLRAKDRLQLNQWIDYLCSVCHFESNQPDTQLSSHDQSKISINNKKKDNGIIIISYTNPHLSLDNDSLGQNESKIDNLNDSTNINETTELNEINEINEKNDFRDFDLISHTVSQLDSVPKVPAISILDTSLDQMYSIPKSQVELEIEKQLNLDTKSISRNSLDKIVPLTHSLGNKDELHRYTNAFTDMLSKHVDANYEKPSSPCNLNDKDLDVFSKVPSFRLEPITPSQIVTSTPLVLDQTERHFNFNHEKDDLHAIKPQINRDLKPKKSDASIESVLLCTGKSPNQNSDGLIKRTNLSSSFSGKVCSKMNNPKIPIRGRPLGSSFISDSKENNLFIESIETKSTKKNSNYNEIEYLDLDLERDDHQSCFSQSSEKREPDCKWTMTKPTLNRTVNKSNSINKMSKFHTSGYIPISECHTGKSIFDQTNSLKKADDSKLVKLSTENLNKLNDLNDNSKENKFNLNERNLLNSSMNSTKDLLIDLNRSQNSGDMNYDVPKQVKCRKFKIKDILNIVPSPPKEENLYANAKSLPRSLQSTKSTTYFNLNDKSVKNISQKLISEREYYNNIDPFDPFDLDRSMNDYVNLNSPLPPPRPPKPDNIAKQKSTSLNSTISDFSINSNLRNNDLINNCSLNIPIPLNKLNQNSNHLNKSFNTHLTLNYSQFQFSNTKHNKPDKQIKSLSRSFTNTPSTVYKTLDFVKTRALHVTAADIKGEKEAQN